MAHMFAPSMEEKGMLSTMSVDYYEIDSKAASSSTLQYRNGFLLTAVVVIAALIYMPNTTYKRVASSLPVAHSSVTKLLPPSISLKDRLQDEAGLQGASLGKEEAGGQKEVMRQTEVRQDIHVRVLRAQSAARVVREANVMVQGAEMNAGAALDMTKAAAKESQEAAEFAVKKALINRQGTGNGDAKAEASAGRAAAATADSKATEALLDAMAASDAADQAARNAREAMNKAEEVSTEAKALRTAAEAAAEEAARAQARADAAGATVDQAQMDALQTFSFVDEMQGALDEMSTAEGHFDTKAFKEMKAKAKETSAKLIQLTEMAAVAEQEAEDAAELAKEVAHAAEVVALVTTNAVADASDAKAMAGQAAKEASEAAAVASQAANKADALQQQWKEVHQDSGEDPLIIQ